MRTSFRVLLAALAAAAAAVGVPSMAAAQAPTPVTFTLTINGPYSGVDAFAVHIDLPLAQQTRTLCVAPGTTGSSAPVCASGRTFTHVYQHTEFPNVPYWYERIRNGSVVQTFARGSVPAPGRGGTTVHATFTFAGAPVSVPVTGAGGESAAMPVGLLLAGLGSLVLAGSWRRATQRRTSARRR